MLVCTRFKLRASDAMGRCRGGCSAARRLAVSYRSAAAPLRDCGGRICQRRAVPFFLKHYCLDYRVHNVAAALLGASLSHLVCLSSTISEFVRRASHSITWMPSRRRRRGRSEARMLNQIDPALLFSFGNFPFYENVPLSPSSSVEIYRRSSLFRSFPSYFLRTSQTHRGFKTSVRFFSFRLLSWISPKCGAKTRLGGEDVCHVSG